MSSMPLVRYITRPTRGSELGLQIWDDGRVEQRRAPAGWQVLTQLEQQEIRQIRGLVAQSGIFDLPATIPAPPGTNDGAACEWQAADGQRSARVQVQGWGDYNRAAAGLRALVLQLDAVIGAAQDRQRR
jgi:hypothetical protein